FHVTGVQTCALPICPDENHPGTKFLHARLWEEEVKDPAPFIPVDWVPPVDTLTDEYPIRLTTGRHLDGYNTGVQSSGFDSPLRKIGRASGRESVELR